jgi:hypothetical protein
MTEARHILILANSARAGKHCVAGKVATLLDDGKFDIGGQWIRLTDPREPEGAVPFANTICKGHGSVRPLQIVKVTLRDHCANPDHPEDWYFDPDKSWELSGRANTSVLAAIADNPPGLWHDGIEFKSVTAGYVRAMNKDAASLYLLKAPEGFKITYHKEFSSFKGHDRKIRKLELRFAGKLHDFSVTDPAFYRRFKLPGAVSEWPVAPVTLAVPNPENVYFCLSLTKLTPPDFDRKHYKICATIFEV